jgi:hypothetical protein
MGHYKSNLRDIEFNLFEVFGGGERLGTGPFAEVDAEVAHDVLRQAEEIATGPLAESFADADRNPPKFDPETGTVTLPQSFKDSYKVLLDSELWRLELPESIGGYGAPPSLRWSVAELKLGANPAAFMYEAGFGFATIVDDLGTEEQKKYAEWMVERQWGSTMVLTEPDAGSDVGAGRAKAIQQPDGTWHIEGVKRFITSGDWDIPENIVHLTLARPEGAAPGTKGLSLFIVPKYIPNEDGSNGERNGVYVTNIEKKMGIKVSATCELTYGEKHPAVGYLLGEEHDGIAQMFKVIEYARMMVGTKAISTLSTGYLNALSYAKERVQGPDLSAFMDKTSPRVTIIHHPDVRRSLMLQKAYAEGLRALVQYTASIQDQVKMAEFDGDEERAKTYERLNDLLLPLVKGVGSERSYEYLAQSLQTLGGSGYTTDYPIEQYIRDAKIDSLYEGTTAIQGMDLFFRKMVRDQFTSVMTLANEIKTFAEDEAADARTKEDRALLLTALEDIQAMVGSMTQNAMAAQEDPRNLYKVGLNTTRLLMCLGDLVVGFLLQRQAAVALAALDAGASARDVPFYEGKLAVAHYFASQVLPRLTAERNAAENTDLGIMDLDEASF